MTKVKSIKSLILIATLALSTVLPVSMGTVHAKSDDQSEWSKWVQHHGKPITQLTLQEHDQFKDMHFLKKTLKDKRIVFLGESSHGAAEFNSVKARMIQYLHEELDYDVIAFESGLGEAHTADVNAYQNSPLQTMQNSIFGIWHSQETLPLFDYLKKEKTTKDPLILAGIDPQPMGNYQNYLKELFSKVDPVMGDKAYQLESKFLQYLYGPTSDLNQFRQEKASMIQEYKELQQFLMEHQEQIEKLNPKHPEQVKVIHYALQDRIKSVEHMVEAYMLVNKYYNEGNYEEAAKYYRISSELRDQAMADHLTWLTEELYPNKKIIVWAHNIHIRKANTKVINPNRLPVLTLGQLLPDRLKKKSYVLGLYMNQGVSALNNREPAPVRFPHPEGNVESILSSSSHKNIFVDLQGQKQKKGTSWMFTERQALDWGLWDESFVPRDQYDGILLINETHMPTYIPEKPTQSIFAIQSKRSIDFQGTILERLNLPVPKMEK